MRLQDDYEGGRENGVLHTPRGTKITVRPTGSKSQRAGSGQVYTGKQKLGTWSDLFLGLLLLCREKKVSSVLPDCPNHCTGSFLSPFFILWPQ